MDGRSAPLHLGWQGLGPLTFGWQLEQLLEQPRGVRLRTGLNWFGQKKVLTCDDAV
jgi:hypothetical protein